MTSRPGRRTLLEDPERHPLRPPSSVAGLGRIVVVAPHPDDESLGCGGLLALAADAGAGAGVVVVTDGSRSHASAAYPPRRLAALRQAEARAAVDALGDGIGIDFLGLPDCGVPAPGTAGWEAAVAGLAGLVAGADTVVVPWRRDPHCDHEAAWRLACDAVDRLPRRPRWVEYPVWAWEHAATDVAPRPGDGRPWRLDVGAVLDRKRRAVAAHVSQTTRLIDDDPDGFVLSPEVLAHFDRPWELYLDA